MADDYLKLNQKLVKLNLNLLGNRVNILLNFIKLNFEGLEYTYLNQIQKDVCKAEDKRA